MGKHKYVFTISVLLLSLFLLLVYPILSWLFCELLFCQRQNSRGRRLAKDMDMDSSDIANLNPPSHSWSAPSSPWPPRLPLLPRGAPPPSPPRSLWYAGDEVDIDCNSRLYPRDLASATLSTAHFRSALMENLKWSLTEVMNEVVDECHGGGRR